MKRSAPLLLAALLLAAAPPGIADESGSKTKSLKEIGKEILEDTKAAGRAIRDSEVARETTGASKDAWRQVKTASVRAAKDVRDATVDFWNGKIVGKEQERDRLKKENARLREEAR